MLSRDERRSVERRKDEILSLKSLQAILFRYQITSCIFIVKFQANLSHVLIIINKILFKNARFKPSIIKDRSQFRF